MPEEKLRLDTFFKQGKKWVWSFKHTKCIECWYCKYKHIAKWVCRGCYDKNRYNTPWRIATKQKQYDRVKNNSEVRKMYNKSSGEYYQRNKEVIILLGNAKRRLKNWLPCLKIMIKGKEIALPFESLEKPKTVWNKDGLSPEYEKWKEKQRKFDVILKFYNK